ncbi:MAG: Gfo/Idh/MocA family protein [Alphaproteobacteria bacterium]
MTASKLRIALIGYGYWGPNLARNLANAKDAELAVICDRDAGRQKAIAALYPKVEFETDLAATLARRDIDAVVIATPSGLHYAQAREALAAGKHVMVEKPLAHSTAEALDLATLAEARRLTLMVGHTFLFNNLVHDVKRRIDAGELGEVFYVYSQRLNLGRFRSDSDVVWTLAPHDVSVLNLWFGAAPTRVSARGHTYIHRRSNVAEIAFVQLEYPGNRSAHLHLSWLDPQKRREMVIVGSERMLVYDDMNSEAHIRLYDKRAEAEHHRTMTDFADFTTRLRAGDLVIPNATLVEPLKTEIAHFVACAREGKRPIADGRNGVEIVAALEAMSRSMADDGRPVAVETPTWPDARV